MIGPVGRARLVNTVVATGTAAAGTPFALVAVMAGQEVLAVLVAALLAVAIATTPKRRRQAE